MRSPSLSRSRLLEALTLAVAIAALAFASPPARAKVVHAIEFHHAVDDRYHVTSVAEEIEKLDNLAQLPRPHGFQVLALPVSIEKASAAWARVVALFEVT